MHPILTLYHVLIFHLSPLWETHGCISISVLVQIALSIPYIHWEAGSSLLPFYEALPEKPSTHTNYHTHPHLVHSTHALANTLTFCPASSSRFMLVRRSSCFSCNTDDSCAVMRCWRASWTQSDQHIISCVYSLYNDLQHLCTVPFIIICF